MNDRDVTNDCVALGFYGLAADASRVESFYSDVLEWFNAIHCPPDKLAVHGPGFSGKPVGFAKANARLSKQGFSDVKAITIVALLSNGTIPALDWWAIASIDLSVGLRPYVAIAARTSVANLEDNAVGQLTESCIENLMPVYGIGFHRNHDKSPCFYAAGVNFGGSPHPKAYEEALTISRWGDLGMVKEVYKQGILRDIYPHNYLSDAQLKREVRNQSLQDWIASDSSRGTLTSAGRMTLWRVALPEMHGVREELQSANIVFDWRSYLGE